jgi:endonuclease YncB( thermonuclease family)
MAEAVELTTHCPSASAFSIGCLLRRFGVLSQILLDAKKGTDYFSVVFSDSASVFKFTETFTWRHHTVQTTRSCTIGCALALCLALGASVAAERREWVTFTNCQYVVTKDCDGDSFRVRSGTNEFYVRLYFVDTPEPNLRYPERNREQSEHFGVTLDETIRAGARARDVAREILQQPFTVRTRYASASGRSREPRYYAFVEVGTNSLATLLVAQGWARTKGVVATLPGGPKSKDVEERLKALEAEARTKRLGIWASATDKKMGTAEGLNK